MKRHNGSGRLRRSARTTEENINPMDGLANLADVMLVFACGLMLALISYWNLDVSALAETTQEIEQGQEIESMEGLDDESGTPLENSDLQEYGMVYKDPASGKLYMVTEE